MTGPRAFAAEELGDARPDELTDALMAAGWLDDSGSDAPATSSGAFSDRVMAALADEPTPSTVGFLVPVRRFGLIGGFSASVRQAWASVGGGRPVLARAAAFAYVLAVAIAGLSLTGAATIGVAGALGVIGPSSTETPAPTAPLPTIAPAPSLTPTLPSDSLPPSIGPTPTPSESPNATDDHGGGSGPSPSDDRGGNSGPGSSSPNSGPGSSSGNSGPGGGGPRPSGSSGGGGPGPG